jgi:hypothetical protein
MSFFVPVPSARQHQGIVPAGIPASGHLAESGAQRPLAEGDKKCSMRVFRLMSNSCTRLSTIRV